MPPAAMLAGEAFGRLVVIERAPGPRSGRVVWLCRCKCGRETSVTTLNLRAGHTKSCGCLKREVAQDRNSRRAQDASEKHGDMVGRRYGRLMVVSQAHPSWKWRVVCDCGTERTVRAYDLVGGNVRSCGCLHRERAAEMGRSRQLGPAGVVRLRWREYVRSSMGHGRKRRANWPHKQHLGFGEWSSIVVRPCHYCGDIDTHAAPSGYVNVRMNGIDRYDNTLGYVQSNCVPCCKRCNRAKGAMHGDDFIALALLIAARYGP